MNQYVYYALCAVLTGGVMLGIYLMSKVQKSVIGNRLSAVCMLLAIILTLVYNNILSVWVLYIALAVGTIIGIYMSVKIKMIQMPQMVALLNGLGGAASAIVGGFAMFAIGTGMDPFSKVTSAVALAVGLLTLVGSLVAAGKLHKILPQKPVVYKGHQLMTTLSLILIFVGVVVFAILKWTPSVALTFFLIELVVSVFFGYIFAIRVGGADMPITISLLNAFSGVAGAIAGLAINDLLLVAVGGIVGASGLLLTQIMCKSMNRKLMDIMLGKTTMQHKKGDAAQAKVVEQIVETQSQSKVAEADPIAILNNAKDVIIVPGYGMAIAQAQHLVKQLADLLVSRGVKVRYAVHPVAGRMPGHMNVLLCEANVDYEDLYEMDTINPDFEKADAAIIVGANDVLNPAAREAKDTPIYGMPVLNVDKCKNIFIFNYDLKPGYAGVENPIYTRKQGVYLNLGDASKTLADFINSIK
ncbi:MAG: NAD(P)(+) transhydrogenase (Re/Si-specific) subunit beta [Clostridia bacterium]